MQRRSQTQAVAVTTATHSTAAITVAAQPEGMAGLAGTAAATPTLPTLTTDIVTRFQHNTKHATSYMLWFATPPIDVVPPPRPLHSTAYLRHREQKRRARNNNNNISKYPQQRAGKSSAAVNSTRSRTIQSLNDVQLAEALTAFGDVQQLQAHQLHQRLQHRGSTVNRVDPSATPS